MAKGARKKKEQQEEPAEVEVTDRRSSAADKKDSVAEEAVPEPPDPELEDDLGDETIEDSEGPTAEQIAQAMMPDSVYDVIPGVVLMLSELAWQKIGLRANPKTGKVQTDFDEAKVAIDTVAFLVDRLLPKAPAEQQRDLRNLVSNLKINFAKQSAAGAENN